MGALPKLGPVGGKTCHKTFDSFIVDNRDPLVPRVGGESCDSSMFRFVWIVDNRDPLVPRVGGESCDNELDVSMRLDCGQSADLCICDPSGAEKDVTQDSEVQNIVQNKFNLLSIMCVQE